MTKIFKVKHNNKITLKIIPNRPYKKYFCDFVSDRGPSINWKCEGSIRHAYCLYLESCGFNASYIKE